MDQRPSSLLLSMQRKQKAETPKRPSLEATILGRIVEHFNNKIIYQLEKRKVPPSTLVLNMEDKHGITTQKSGVSVIMSGNHAAVSAKQ